MKAIRNNIPNFITLLRIIGTIALLFVEPLTIPYYSLYTFCGVTDVLDGFLARILHVSSRIGSIMDSVADLTFYTVTLLRLANIFFDILPWSFWLVFVAAVGIRVASYIVAGRKFHLFASVHTYANKFSGLLVFLVPYFLKTQFRVEICFAVTVIAGLASLEELILHVKSDRYRHEFRSIFFQPGNPKGADIDSAKH